MKRVLLSVLAFGLAAPVIQARQRDASEKEATVEHVRQLQDELRNLEAELEAVELRDADVPDRYRERVEEIRNEAIYIRVHMQKRREAGESGTGVPESNVTELRRDIAALVPVLRRLGTGESAPATVVPIGTQLTVRLQDHVSSETSEPGDRFVATVNEPVLRLGDVAIPAGSLVQGVVESVDRASSRTDRSSRVVLTFESIEVDGRSHPLSATVVDASEDMETGLGSEKEKIGIGAGVGGILGAVLGGKKGAVLGAVIGGAGAILGTEGEDVDLPPGVLLELRLDRELSIDGTRSSSF